MKKLFKIIIWIVGSFFLILIIGLICKYLLLSNKWKEYYSESEMQTLAKEIDLIQPLPDTFYIAYDKIFPNQRNRSLAKMSFQVIWYLLTKQDDMSMNYRQCNCILATIFFENKVPLKYHSWSSYITAHGLEKYTSENKCLDFYYKELRIYDYSDLLFSKPLQELTIEQNIELILRIEHPMLYNERPDLLEQELKKYEQ